MHALREAHDPRPLSASPPPLFCARCRLSESRSASRARRPATSSSGSPSCSARSPPPPWHRAHRRAIGPVIGAHGGVPGRVGMEGQRGVSVTRGCDGWGGAADDCAALRAGPHQGPVGALERGRHRLLVRPPPRPPRLTPTASAPRIPVALRAPLRLRGGGAVRDQGLIDAAARPVPAAGTARMPKGHAWPRAAAVPRPLNNVSGT